ncbi:phage head closure protein [Clostridium sp. Sa3CUN1]|uniref:Phage head closure protein n=1 Tax=Clostridium gallinarum TaxID=2762246 RepID=A0ABR8Q2D3_9CLOT|nr:phage head closure protein [Clostridium gallinarum]MBD7914557.1 phage head closure protein [Clostridium gallinarum]
MWCDILELATLSVIANDNGVEDKTFITREVFCNEKSVTTNEYYQSSQNGNEIKIIFEVKQIDYEKEQYIIYENETYKVVRTYKTNSEDIELHCALKEGLV